MKRWNLDRAPYPIPLLAPATDGMPGAAPDPEESVVIAAFCELVAEIMIGALLPVEVNSPVDAEHAPA